MGHACAPPSSTRAGEGKLDEAQKRSPARSTTRSAKSRVLDPACGTGNFLYVTLEHLKRLEGEVCATSTSSANTQVALETAGATGRPAPVPRNRDQPARRAIAELVLWIGYLQWHFRTRGQCHAASRSSRDFHNIECRDAVLAWDRTSRCSRRAGKPVTRWDGETTKRHPVTGEEVPDETARVPV